MQKQTPSKQNWFMRMFCCTSAPQPQLELKRPPKKAVTIKKKGKIQLSLIGSTAVFTLCKLTRKNVAIDAYKFKGTLPNPVNRYLSERIRGDIGLFRGDMSSILFRHITYPTRLIGSGEQLKSNAVCDVVRGNPSFYRKGSIDYYVWAPKTGALGGTHDVGQLTAELHEICQRCESVVLLLSSEIVLDQLGMLLPSLPDKEVQIESIVVSGKCIQQIVYISSNVRIRQEEKVDFLIKELLVGSQGQEDNIRSLIELLLKHTGVRQLIKMLVQSIGDATASEPILTCFLRNVVICEWATESELEKWFRPNQFVISQTPNMARTGSFGMLTGRLSVREDGPLNINNPSKHSFEVESEEYDEFTLKGQNSQFEESTRHG